MDYDSWILNDLRVWDCDDVYSLDFSVYCRETIHKLNFTNDEFDHIECDQCDHETRERKQNTQNG